MVKTKIIDGVTSIKKESAKGKKVMLILLDGWGINYSFAHNAIAFANPSYFNYLWEHYPHQLLKSTGEKESAYQSIFAGLIIPPLEKRVLSETNSCLKAFFEKIKRKNLHLIGLINEKDNRLLFHFLETAKNYNLVGIFVHLIIDEKSRNLLPGVISRIQKTNLAKIATICGAFYLGRPAKTKFLGEAIFQAKGEEVASVKEALATSQKDGFENNYLVPTVLPAAAGSLEPADGLVFFNFENEVSQRLKKFIPPKSSLVVFDDWAKNCFGNKTKNTLGDLLSRHHKKQFSAQKIDQILEDKNDDFICFSISNIAESASRGDFDRTVKAIQEVDRQLAKIIPNAQENNYHILLTGSFGLAEQINKEEASFCPVPFIYLPPEGKIRQEGDLIKNHDHQLFRDFVFEKHTLADLAPTVLAIMGLAKPSTMTGRSLVE